MIAVDTNILVYAHRSEMRHHGPALAALTGLSEGVRSWGIPWPCVHEFLAIVTNRRIFPDATPTELALVEVESWLASPSVALLSEEAGYWLVLRDLLATSNVTAGRIHDARVAALCLLNGVTEFWSADRDFLQFPRLKTVNPIPLMQ